MTTYHTRIGGPIRVTFEEGRYCFDGNPVQLPCKVVDGDLSVIIRTPCELREYLADPTLANLHA